MGANSLVIAKISSHFSALSIVIVKPRTEQMPIHYFAHLLDYRWNEVFKKNYFQFVYEDSGGADVEVLVCRCKVLL